MKISLGLSNNLYRKSIGNGAFLGAGVGTLFPAIVAAIYFGKDRILAFSAVLCIGYFFSVFAVWIVSCLISPWLIPLLLRYQRQRHLVFAFAGGIIGLILFSIVLGWIAFTLRTRNLPDLEDCLWILGAGTVPFLYGALTGFFTSVDIGRTHPPIEIRRTDH